MRMFDFTCNNFVGSMFFSVISPIFAIFESQIILPSAHVFCSTTLKLVPASMLPTFSLSTSGFAQIAILLSPFNSKEATQKISRGQHAINNRHLPQRFIYLLIASNRKFYVEK